MNPSTHHSLFARAVASLVAVVLTPTVLSQVDVAPGTAVPATPAAAAREPAPPPEPATPVPPAPPAAVNSGGGYGGFGIAAPHPYGGGNNAFGGSGGYGGGGYAAGGIGGSGSYGVYRTSGRREPVPPLVVEFSTPDPAVLQQLEEDLSIMGHLLDQTLERGLGEEAPPSKMGVPLIFTSGGRAARALYLEGFGALFMVKVNMPLVAPPAAAAEKPAKPTDSEWESARREVMGLETRSEALGGGAISADVPFDSEAVETLKQNLIAALKNASNIRHLKSEDYVSIAVFGQPTAVPTPAFGWQESGVTQKTSPRSSDESVSTSKPPGSSRTVKSSNRRSVAVSSGVMTSSKPFPVSAPAGTVLTLRAKAADISALADGKLSLDDFTKKVSVNTYTGNGFGLSSVNSWILNSRGTSAIVR